MIGNTGIWQGTSSPLHLFTSSPLHPVTGCQLPECYIKLSLYIIAAKFIEAS
jgi:hypothetical protein